MNQDLTKELAAAQAELVASKEATARAEAKIAAVQAELAKPTPWARWKPGDGGCYYFVKSNGVVTQYPWDGGNQDFGYYNFGNVHPTYEVAERHAKRIRSMGPTCPVPKVGEEAWFIGAALNHFNSRWDGDESDCALYNLGRVFATLEAAQAWLDEFADAWTTLEEKNQ